MDFKTNHHRLRFQKEISGNQIEEIEEVVKVLGETFYNSFFDDLDKTPALQYCLR